MIPVSKADTVRALDSAVISEVGVPGYLLMEVAGRGAASAIHQKWPTRHALVLCGPGNNGGDGYVVARWLSLWGHAVTIIAPIPPKTTDAKRNADLCARLGVPLVSIEEAPECESIWVDGLLGTGQNAAPRGPILACVQVANQSPHPVIALDLPTGVDADTGQDLGSKATSISADLTVTFGHMKPGLLCMPGPKRAGEVEVIDIGLGLADTIPEGPAFPDAWLIQQKDIEDWTPPANNADAKWDRGHVAVRGGGGAAVLAAHGAFRAGAGLVTLLAPRDQWDHLHGLWPEVIVAEPGDLNPKRHDTLVLGPGLGLGESLAEEVVHHWKTFPGTLVADADAITHLASQPPPVAPSTQRVVTPHAAEAARLLQRTRADVEANRLGAAHALERWGVSILKGPNSIITGPSGAWFNPVCCGRLATAGSGDVLAGMVGTFLSKGLDPQRAAAMAAWHHGRAGQHMPVHGTCQDLLQALHNFGFQPTSHA